MQDLKGLTIKDFKTKANVIVGKLELDRYGIGDWTELKDVVDFSVSSSLVNFLQKTYAFSFSARILNTQDKYSLYDPRADKYKYIRQGKRVRIYLGIRKDRKYEWNWFYGIIDKVTFSYDANSQICDITGRDYIAYLQENYLKNLFWGKYYSFSVIPNKEKYTLPGDCKGIHQAWYTDELTLNSQYTYDWEYNQFIWLHPSIPIENGKVYIHYYTPQKIKNVVADLLEEVGLLSTSFKQQWLNEYANVGDKIIDRVYFKKDTNYLDAINMLAEVALARFYINPEGIPCFRKIPVIYLRSATRLFDNEYNVKNIEERLDELYNHFLIEGERRVMKRINLGVYSAGYDLDNTTITFYGAVSADGLSSAREGGTWLTEKGFIWRKVIFEDGEASGHGTEQTKKFYSKKMGTFSYSTTLDDNSTYEWKVYAKNKLGHYDETLWETVKVGQ